MNQVTNGAVVPADKKSPAPMTQAEQEQKAIEEVLIQGDLTRLTAPQRIRYYREVCESLKINHLTRPFDYVAYQGKLQLYARKDCSEQLRLRDSVSVKITDRKAEAGCFIVTAQASKPSGRVDESIGAVSIEGLKGDALANAMMKAETKAKRRVTLSICGLNFPDETELDTMQGARRNVVDLDTGELIAAVMPPELKTVEVKTADGATVEVTPKPRKDETPKQAETRKLMGDGRTWAYLWKAIEENRDAEQLKKMKKELVLKFGAIKDEATGYLHTAEAVHEFADYLMETPGRNDKATEAA